ncbi:MAG TPA: glycosyltransferase, partial [Bacteroidia bacterium]|nr:glycosyltransferase [Bacteroidia bacterium]
MSEKKRAIVLLVPGFPATEQDTTCLPFIYQFCLSFLKLRPDIELRIISFQYPFKRGHYLWNGIKVYSAGGKSHKFNRFLTWIRASVQFLKIKKEYNITVINSFWMTECAFVGQWLARAFNIRHVVYVIGQDALRSNKYLPLINFSKMEMIAMSESLVNHFYEATGYKIGHIIPAGVDTDKIKPAHAERTIDILGVGALIPLKGYLLFPELINALKKDFPGIKACIIGNGVEKETIQEKIKAYGLENNLELIGGIPHTEVFSYMQRSKIFLHTSSYEGQSTVIMEALASGLNIVCFDIGRADVKDRIWACRDKDEMLLKLKELLSSKLTYKPVVLLTNEDMVREFFKIYEN